MNKIICDECKAEIQITKGLIETKHLSGGIQINFFRCKKCNSKYLIDVTDRATREKQIEYTKLASMHESLNLFEKNKTIEEILKENIDNMNMLQAEIKESKAELKKKYEGEL